MVLSAMENKQCEKRLSGTRQNRPGSSRGRRPNTGLQYNADLGIVPELQSMCAGLEVCLRTAIITCLNAIIGSACGSDAVDCGRVSRVRQRTGLTRLTNGVQNAGIDKRRIISNHTSVNCSLSNACNTLRHNTLSYSNRIKLKTLLVKDRYICHHFLS